MCTRYLLAYHKVEHHIAGSLGYGTAIPRKGPVRDHSVTDLEGQYDIVTTGGINAFKCNVRVRKLMLMRRMHIMFC